MQLPNITSPKCELCEAGTLDSLQHALLECSQNEPTTSLLLRCLRTETPNLQVDQIFSFNFPLEPEMELPIIYIVSSILHQVWIDRNLKKTPSVINTRARLEAGIQILRKSRHSGAANLIEEIFKKI